MSANGRRTGSARYSLRPASNTSPTSQPSGPAMTPDDATNTSHGTAPGSCQPPTDAMDLCDPAECRDPAQEKPISEPRKPQHSAALSDDDPAIPDYSNVSPEEILKEMAAEQAEIDEGVMFIFERLHPAMGKCIRIIAESVIRKRLKDVHNQCHQRIAELEKEVAEFRLVREAQEHSTNYNWQVTDERLVGLEKKMANGRNAAIDEENPGIYNDAQDQPQVHASRTGDKHHSSPTRIKVVSKNSSGTTKNTPSSQAIEGPRGQNDENIAPEFRPDSQSQDAMEGVIPSKSSVTNTTVTPAHPNDLSSGHLKVAFDRLGKIHAHMTPPIPLSGRRILFLGSHLKTSSGYPVVEIGLRPSQPNVKFSPSEEDIVVLPNPGTYKLLLKLYLQLGDRKVQLIQQWEAENPAFAHKLGPPKPYMIIPDKSPRFRELMNKDVPQTLDVLPHETVRYGIIYMNSRGKCGQTEARRLLAERVIIATSGPLINPDAARFIYFNVATGAQVQRRPTDVVVEESELVYECLGWMYHAIGEADLMDRDELAARTKPPAKRTKEPEPEEESAEKSRKKARK